MEETLDENSTNVFFAIRLEQDGPAIGLISLRNIHPVHRFAELFVRIGLHDLRGKGYGTTAIREAIDFALGTSIFSAFTSMFSPQCPGGAHTREGRANGEGRLRRGRTSTASGTMFY